MRAECIGTWAQQPTQGKYLVDVSCDDDGEGGDDNDGDGGGSRGRGGNNDDLCILEIHSP